MEAGYLTLSNELSLKWSQMIAMEDVDRWQKFLPVRQCLFLLDACFSGPADLVPKPETPKDQRIQQLSQPSHHFMKAGTESEKTIASDAWGGSLFSTAVLDGLRGAADASSDVTTIGSHQEQIEISREQLDEAYGDSILPEYLTIRPCSEVDWYDEWHRDR